MIKININPNKQLFKWGPIDGHLIYVDFFNIAFTNYQKKFYPLPDIIGYFTKEKMILIADNQALYDSGEINFRRYILPDKNFKKYYKEWNDVLKKFLDFQKIINPEYLKRLDHLELLKVFKNCSGLYFNFWLIGLLPELSNWGGEQMLKRELEKKAKSDDFTMLFERLSAPDNLSFYREADLELLRLKKYQGKKLFDEKISAHQQKYFHILNSYHQTKVLNKNYFKKELLQYSLAKANTKIKELELFQQKTERARQKLIKKYNLGSRITKIASRLSFCIWWQDLRKFYIFRANHVIDLFLKEFSKRHKVGFKDLHYYNFYKLMDLVENNRKLSKSELKKRFEYLLFLYSIKKNSLEYFSGRSVKKFIKPYLEISIDKNIQQIKGLIVSCGKNVKAKVRILTSPKEVYKMKPGEILVASMTSPDYITAIKKASAIITNEGGMTCHAAIVARELGIPCIVGTKIATEVLKDGDIVEVNANHGWVRKIKKA